MRSGYSKRRKGFGQLFLEPLEPRTMLAADPIISEFMASNQTTLFDEDGDSSDWIELFNPDIEAVQLDGWHLTDNPANLTKWQLPSLSLQPGEHQIVFASGKDRTVPGETLHTNFKLSAAGEYLALVQPDGVNIASAYAPTFPAQDADVSYGVGVDQQEGYFFTPTPGLANSVSAVANLSHQIVISEVMYHPSSHSSSEEYIELLNRGASSVDLSGWRFNDGIDFDFSPATILDAGEYLVVAADSEVFAETYPDAAPAFGPWRGQLSNSGERIRLVDGQGRTIDEVSYADEGDWSQRKSEAFENFATLGWVWADDHDGGGKSLELINPNLPNEFGQNWSASLTEQGTPGEENLVASTNIAPLIYDVQHSPVIPSSTDSVTVSMRFLDETTTTTPTLSWRVDGQPEFTTAPMSDAGANGDAMEGDGLFSASIPPQPTGTIVEFYVQAQDSSELVRTWPAAVADGTQVTNMLYQVDDLFDPSVVREPGTPPVYYQIMTAAERSQFETTNRDNNAQRHATLITVTGSGIDVRHSVSVRYRGSGSRRANPPNNRLNIPSDRPWNGLTSINMNVISVVDQVLGSLVFRLAGMPSAEAKPVTMYSNGVNLFGTRFYAQVEVLGADFAENQFPQDPDGNLYGGRRPNESPPGGKGAGLAYFGEEPEPYVSYIKQTNVSEADWSDVINLTRTLNNSSDEEYLDAIEEVIDVDQWLRHLALHALISNTEGGLVNGDRFGDDYAMYSGAVDPRFILVPHDLDSLFDPGQTNRSLYLARGVPALKRLIDHPQLRPRYYAHIEDLLNNVLLTEDTAVAIRQVGKLLLNDAQLNGVFEFFEARRDYAFGILPSGSLTVESDLPVQGEFPRSTTDLVSLRGIVSRNTQSVLVNGQPATIDFFPVEKEWSFGDGVTTGVTLRPGINRIIVEAFDQIDHQGELIETAAYDVWYDDGSVQDVSGALPSGETIWFAADGPYHVTGPLTVPQDGSLTIQPGTSIYFEPDTYLDVRGQLTAQGTAYQRIRFTSVPGAPLVPDQPTGRPGLPDAPPHWAGIRYVDTSSDQNIVSYADIEYAQSSQGSINVSQSTAVIDNVSFAGTHLRMIQANSASLIIENSVFPDMFAEGESPAALGLDNMAEHIKATGRPPTGGHFIIRNNLFGTNKGHNDVIDADSGRRPNPILQILDNVFLGAGDELLDLGGDAYVAGNRFMNVFKDDETSDRGYANAISTGDAGSNTTVVVARNTFWEVDHAINLKRGTATIFENNTVVAVHPDFDDRFGNPNIGSAINLYVDEPGAVAGWGAYAARNIFFDVPRVFGNADLPNGTQPLELHDNLLTRTLSRQQIGDRAGTILNLGEGNSVGDPRFVDAAMGDFALQPGSPAFATTQSRIGIGADVSADIAIWGEPTSTTGNRSATLHVGGPGLFAYRYRVNGGPWSIDTPIGSLGFNPGENVRTGQIELSNLADGSYTVEVLGQDFAGEWQSQPTVSQTWTVQTAGNLIISEVLASNTGAVSHAGSTPDYIELHNTGGTEMNLNGFRLTDNDNQRDKFVFTSDTVIQPGAFLIVYADSMTNLPGIHTGFGLDASGETVILSDSAGRVLDSVRFGSQIANRSISRIGPSQSWQLSVPTPSAENQWQRTGDPSKLTINEWLASSATSEDFIELYNRDSLPVALDGLFLTDELAGNPTQQRLASLSFVGGDDVLALFADDQLKFSLSADQEILALLDRNQHVIDSVAYYPQVSGVSQGRGPDGDNELQYFAQPSPGARNIALIPGDIDGDGAVGFSDFLVLSSGFGLTDARRDEGDLDRDGRVGFTDFLILSANFGR